MNQSMNQVGDDEGRDRLREIDETLDRLRAELPSPSDDPTDFVDSGQYLAARQELEGQIELLESERERLRGRLGMS
ncbi:hypothetical protein [Actinomadura livida]|uniref:Uncharacterized protein n=1 Tax=Actinomadura livida TaxID=79909 RepID=A0A7W7IA19_9ACTN|nr:MULTISPECIES: hypothetical protein [Actinomadura]MBB4773204.1 hypothetical protein [Actinomadura catellatispora]GGU18750.1 hypothetical protein GCM10010208_49920 [Actinomadura livida]